MEERNHTLDPASAQAVTHLRSSLADGKHWVHALLESMSLWTLPEEVFQERHYRYLLDGEAFDWLVLAERLLAEVDSLVPEDEKARLLFSGDTSYAVSEEEFRRLLGPHKHSAYLNYWYGVVVEEALLQCAEEEEWKRIRSGGLRSASGVTKRAFLRVYGQPQTELLLGFRKEKGYPNVPEMSLTEAKEFTYWLFKYRVNNSEGARVASDTRKAILYLESLRTRAGRRG
ncbi:MAG: hypothetical protein HYX93_05805 [Chloroflexi bacterium]|nr:hypothetical protein [Chloroflexota bacterium]